MRTIDSDNWRVAETAFERQGAFLFEQEATVNHCRGAACNQYDTLFVSIRCV